MHKVDVSTLGCRQRTALIQPRFKIAVLTRIANNRLKSILVAVANFLVCFGFVFLADLRSIASSEG